MAGAAVARVTAFPSTCGSSAFPVGSRRLLCREGVVSAGGQFRRTTSTSGLTTLKYPILINRSHRSRKIVSEIQFRDTRVGSNQVSKVLNTPKSDSKRIGTGDNFPNDSKPSYHDLKTQGFRRSEPKPSNASEQTIRFPFYSTISNFLLDRLEKSLLKGSLKPTNYYLQGNYAPVEECGPGPALSVTGLLPECLNGEFFMISPNPKFEPIAKYHWFDGDGMVHGLRIKDGKVTYARRFVRTARLKQEEYWGVAKFLKIGDMVGTKGLSSVFVQVLRLIFGVLDMSNGCGTANTSLAYHNGKLLVLGEEDMPYVMRVLEDGDVETLSRHDYDKKLDHQLTAHPKIDPVTGEMFTFGYEFRVPPYAKYRVISKDGVMGDPVPITLSGPAMMHDWAITENYAIFIDCPLHFNPKDMINTEAFAFAFDKAKPIRFGVLPRYAKDESQMRWFEFSNGLLLHTANAWEEGDEIILIACRDANPDLTIFSDYDKEKSESVNRQLWEYRFNLKSGKTGERMLGEFNTDFPMINSEYVGRKNRYIYTGIFEDASRVIGVAKFDLTLEPELGKSKWEVGGNMTGVFWHGSGRYGSEPLHIPKNPGKNGDEDDSYLLCFVHDENTGKSEAVVIDAKTLSSDPVAVIELPSRVPYGFHCLFMTEYLLLGALFSLELPLHKAFEKLAAQYGPIVLYRVGVQTVVVVSSAELAEEVLKRKDREFSGRSIPMNRSISRHVGFEGKVFAYADYNAEYRLLRTVSHQEFFTGTKLKSYEELRTKEMAVMVEKIFRQIDNSKPEDSTTVDIGKALGTMILNVMLQLVVGKRFESLPPTDELRQLPSILDELSKLFMEFNMVDCFPFLDGFDPQGLLKKMKAYDKRQRGFYGKILEECRQEREMKREACTLTETDMGSPNFVDVLLRLQEEGGKISDNEIMATTMTILSASVDTTSASMEWVIGELVRNPKSLQRLHAELDAVVGKERPLMESDLQALPYLRAVVLEALRLYPVIPMTFPHICKQDSTIGGYFIPANAAIFVNLYTIGRDATVWEDPLQFNPDRFMGDSLVPGESMKANGSNFHLLPFGSGRRSCLGYNLAIVLLSRAAATLVHAFDWGTPPGVSREQLITGEARSKLMLHPSPDLFLTPIPRLSSNVYQSI